MRSNRRRIGFPLAFLGLSGVLFAIHCGDSAENSEFDGPDPCDGVYKGECGVACKVDTDCPSGLFCDATLTCTAQCAQGAQCDGVLCSPRGRCGGTDPGNFGDAGTGDGGTGNTDAICADTNVALTPVVPKVLFLLDQSSSMFYNKFPSGDSMGCNPDCRWSVLKDTIIGPNSMPGGVVMTLEGQAELGVQMFSATDSTNGTNLTGPTDNVCPRFNGKTFVPTAFALNNYPAINALLRDAGVDNDTPTGAAILTVSGLGTDGGISDPNGFAALTGNAPKVIVLVTDGEAAICGDPDPSDAGQSQVVAAAQAAYKQKIQTFVIAIGNNTPDAIAHFTEVANAGQGMDPDKGDASAILPSTPAELVTDLQNIVLNARTCTFTLSGMVQAGSESSGTVTLNGANVPYNTADGWVLTNSSTLVLQGGACNTLKTSPNATLTATFPCGTITNVPK